MFNVNKYIYWVNVQCQTFNCSNSVVNIVVSEMFLHTVKYITGIRSKFLQKTMQNENLRF